MGFIRQVGRVPIPGDVWFPCTMCTTGRSGNEPVTTDTMQPAASYAPSNLCPGCEGEGGAWWPPMPSREAK
jgi:hypothetical protein